MTVNEFIKYLQDNLTKEQLNYEIIYIDFTIDIMHIEINEKNKEIYVE